MELSIYSTATLLGVLRQTQLDTFSPFWLNFFPGSMNFQTREIIFEMIPRQRKMAPFVAPNVQGRIMRSQGSTTRSFKPAYIKPKHEVDPSRTLVRRAGEAILGSQSPQQRWDAIVAENLAMEKEAIMRRWEWMCARAVIDGAVTISGEDYPTQTVDFGRHSSLKGVLVGAAMWSDPSSTPLADLEHYRRQVQFLTGTTISRLIFGLDAWTAFSQHADVKALLNTLVRGSETSYNIAVPDATPYEFRGTLTGQNGLGRLDLYTYSDTYEAEDGSGQLVPFLDSGTLVGVGAGIDGMQLFGAIQDKRAGMAALSMFPKMWDQEDPSITYTMTQSAPLFVPMQPNAAFSLKVVASTFTYPNINLGYPDSDRTPGYHSTY
jgi:hypothetical protein